MRPKAAARLLTVALILVATRADAACDLIPQSQQTFRGPLGTINRPFASPGDVVEIDVRTELCDSRSTGWLQNASDHVVTLVFEPPAPGPRRAVVLAGDCNDLDLQADLALCPASLGAGGTVTCHDGSQGQATGLALVPRGATEHLSFRFPETDAILAPPGDREGLTGPVSVAVTGLGDPLPCGLRAAQPCSVQSGVIACVDKLYEVDGTCETGMEDTDSVFSDFTALPIANIYQRSCFRDAPPCNPLDPSLRVAVDRSGNLLVPFDWRGVLANQPGLAVPRLLRATVRPPTPIDIAASVFLSSFTPEGASLPPIFEPQADPDAADPNVVTLFGTVDAPGSVLRVGVFRGQCTAGDLGTSCVTSEECGGAPCRAVCTGGANHREFCDEQDPDTCPGGLCGKLYDENAMKVLGIDGGSTELVRLHSAPEPTGICQNEPTACSTDAECPIPPGEVSVPCVRYALEATLPVALESLSASSADILSLIARENVVGRELNGDITQDPGPPFEHDNDVVVTLRDRKTGEIIPVAPYAGYSHARPGPTIDPTCGTDGSTLGRPVIELDKPPFRFAALESEGDVTAFLQSENGEAYCDVNQDLDRHDSILRVFSLTEPPAPPGGVDETAAILPRRAVDASPRINQRSLAVSGGKVFFRSSEAQMAQQKTKAASLTPSGTAGDTLGRLDVAIAGDGGCVAFTSRSTDLLGAGVDSNGYADAFVRDRVTGALERVSLTAAGGETNGDTFEVSASADCRFVAFSSAAANLPNGGPRGIFLRDRCVVHGVSVPGCTPSVERIDIAAAGGAPNGPSARPRLSPDARFVVFEGAATDLVGVGTDGNGKVDVFVRDRCLTGGSPVGGCTPATERASVASGGAESDEHSGVASISADGRYVAFASGAHTLGAANLSEFIHVYVRDRDAGATELIDVTLAGTESSGNGLGPRISADGRFVMFSSTAPDLIATDTNGAQDVFVRDRERGTTEAISVDATGTLVPNETTGVDISNDGRYVLFSTPSNASLQPMVNVNGSDLVVRDRLLGITDRADQLGHIHDLDRGVVECRPGVPAGFDGEVGMVVGSGSAMVFDPSTDTVRGIVPAAGGVECAVSPDGAFGYVSFGNGSGNEVRVIDTISEPPALASGTNPVPSSVGYGDMAVSPDGRHVVICGTTPNVNVTPGSVYVIDTVTRSITDSVSFPSRICQAVETCDDGAVLVLIRQNLPSLPSTLRRFLLQPDGTLQDAGFTSGGPPGDFIDSYNITCAAGSQTLVYAAGAQTTGLRPFGYAFLRPRPFQFRSAWGHGGAIDTVLLNRAGTRMYLRYQTGPDTVVEGMQVNATAGLLLGNLPYIVTSSLPAVPGGEHMALDASGKKLYVPEFDGVHVLDAETFDLLDVITDPGMPSPAGICIGGGRAEQPECAAMSGDGQSWVFTSWDTLLYPPGGNPSGNADVFVRAADSTDPLGIDTLLFADGALDDTVLEVLDTNGPGQTLTTLCPAEDVAVENGMALFLRPESAAGTAACPGGSLNAGADADTSDLVVQFWPGSGPVLNQSLAASAVAMSDTHLAALVSETGQNAALNSDGPDGDHVVHVRAANGSGWTNTAQAADSMRVCGSVVVFATPEAEQGAVLNGDGLMDDRVLQFYDASAPAPTVVNTGQAVEDFVCGPSLIAFRTRESAQGADLNGGGSGDGDLLDDVLQVWDLSDPACRSGSPASSCRVNTRQAVTPCALEACGPRLPYRVVDRSVKFLTFECDQGGTVTTGVPACPTGGTDMNADGNADDLILQVFEFSAPAARAIAGLAEENVTDPLVDGGDDAGVVFVGSGRCIEHFATPCVADTDCGSGEFCAGATCARDHRPCEQDSDCPAGISCEGERSTPASADTDHDGVPDHTDNCTEVVNADQADLDADGAGDACDRMTCGDGVRTHTELCEPSVGDTQQCGANPCTNCHCECGTPGIDPRARVIVVTKNNMGTLTASMKIQLANFTGNEPIRVPLSIRLSDTDSPSIAELSLDEIAPLGRTGKYWQYKPVPTPASGITLIKLTRVARTTDQYKLTIKAKKWFSAAAANQLYSSTALTVTAGTHCVRHTVNIKRD